MAAMAGILNQQNTVGQALTGAGRSPMATTATTSGSTDSSSSSSASISANDFLTLLVTEMQNQDPTANTDPNQYINQLVSVNSLEQLIDINQNLSTALGSSTPSSGSGSPSTQAVASPSSLTGRGAAGQLPASAHAASSPGAVRLPGSGASATSSATSPATGVKRAPGNLNIPETRAAANRVGHALNGQSRTHSFASGLTGAL
jgi:flagellar basal-body rod modification protein FlgD